MKNTVKAFGIIVLAAVIVFAFVGCGDGAGGGGDGEPISGLTITGLGAFEGQYIFAGGDSSDIGACVSITGTTPADFSVTGGRISGGTVTLKVWNIDGTPYTGSGNRTFNVFIKASNPFVYADFDSDENPACKGTVTAVLTSGIGSGVFMPKSPSGLTITNLGDFNDSYAVALADSMIGAFVSVEGDQFDFIMTGGLISGGKVTMAIYDGFGDLFTGSGPEQFHVYIKSEDTFLPAEVSGPGNPNYKGEVYVTLTNGKGTGALVPGLPEAKVIAPEWRQTCTVGTFQESAAGTNCPGPTTTVGEDTITIDHPDLGSPVVLSNVYTEGGGPLTLPAPSAWTYVYKDSAKIGFMICYTDGSNVFYFFHLGDSAKTSAATYEGSFGITIDLSGVPDYPFLLAMK